MRSIGRKGWRMILKNLWLSVIIIIKWNILIKSVQFYIIYKHSYLEVGEFEYGLHCGLQRHLATTWLNLSYCRSSFPWMVFIWQMTRLRCIWGKWLGFMEFTYRLYPIVVPHSLPISWNTFKRVIILGLSLEQLLMCTRFGKHIVLFKHSKLFETNCD